MRKAHEGIHSQSVALGHKRLNPPEFAKHPLDQGFILVRIRQVFDIEISKLVAGPCLCRSVRGADVELIILRLGYRELGVCCTFKVDVSLASGSVIVVQFDFGHLDFAETLEFLVKHGKSVVCWHVSNEDIGVFQVNGVSHVVAIRQRATLLSIDFKVLKFLSHDPG